MSQGSEGLLKEEAQKTKWSNATLFSVLSLGVIFLPGGVRTVRRLPDLSDATPPTAGGGANQTVMQSSVPPAFSVSAVLPTPVLRTELCDTSHKDNSQDAKGNTQTQTKAAAAVGKSHWCSTSLLKNEPNGKCVNIGAEIQRIKKCLHSSHRSF